MNALKKFYTSAVARPAAKLYLVAGSTAMTAVAQAADDGSDATAQITAAATTVAGIAAAVLTVYVSIKVFKLIRAAL